MYTHILIPLENSEADQTILNHVSRLAKLTGARFLLVHVADGFVARNYTELELQEGDEIREDRKYLETVAADLRQQGFEVRVMLAMGEPAQEIIRIAKEEPVDLIAMSTHGHRMFEDILYGSTADKVRHAVDIPVLLLKAKHAKPPESQ